MTELSPASLRSIRWTVTLAASLGWFFDAYVITIYALTVPLLAAEFHLATNILSGAIGSIFLFGYTIETAADVAYALGAIAGAMAAGD
jgi:MFS transporter, putative metabolite:H+ symporter